MIQNYIQLSMNSSQENNRINGRLLTLKKYMLCAVFEFYNEHTILGRNNSRRVIQYMRYMLSTRVNNNGGTASAKGVHPHVVHRTMLRGKTNDAIGQKKFIKPCTREHAIRGKRETPTTQNHRPANCR